MVGGASAVAAVLFQTVSGNRILTPAVVGFDAHFVLLQTGLVVIRGGIGAAALSAGLRFGLELGLLLGAALLLFGALPGLRRQDLPRMVVTGIILGLLFRSLASFLQRRIDPSDFVVAQASSFASFGAVTQDVRASRRFSWRSRRRAPGPRATGSTCWPWGVTPPSAWGWITPTRCS